MVLGFGAILWARHRAEGYRLERAREDLKRTADGMVRTVERIAASAQPPTHTSELESRVLMDALAREERAKVALRSVLTRIHADPAEVEALFDLIDGKKAGDL